MTGGLDGLVSGFTDEVMVRGFDLLIVWMARGLGFLIEWVWTTLETGTTPRLTDGWFSDLFEQVALLALGVTAALMLAAAMQGALSGSPEQIWAAVKQAAWSIVATGLAIVVMTELMHVVDEASNALWAGARTELRAVLDRLGAVVAGSLGPLGFLAVLVQLVLYLGLIGLGVTLGMRGTLIYLVAALCPLVFSSSVLGMFRESARKLVHVGVALIGSKLAIVIALVVTVKLAGGPQSFVGQADAAAAFGAMMTAATMFVIASLMPIVLYKLMPTIEGAVVASGVAGSWGRAAMTGMYAGNGLRALSGARGRQTPANRPIPSSPRRRAPRSAGPSPGRSTAPAASGASGSAGAAPVAVPLAALKAAKAVGNRARGVASDTADAGGDRDGTGTVGGTHGGSRPRLRASTRPARDGGGGAASGAGGAGASGRSGANPAKGRAPRPRARRYEDAVFDDLVDKGWLGPDDGSDY